MIGHQKIYALLVGIDHYPASVPSLQGCVNDINAIETYLQHRVNSEASHLQLLTLKNQDATRQAVIDGFRQHLCQAEPDDVAIFYYSGHGSQEKSPPEFWHLEPDRLDETLVCYDSRTETGWDLADKELAKLLAEVSQKNPHLIVILDCCHSGSGTRNVRLQETGVRRLETDKRQRPLDSFLFSATEAATFSNSRSPEQNPSGWKLPQGRYVLMSACRDCEEAKEFYGDGQHRGAFSYFLTETLQKANGTLSYRDLFKRANAIVRCRVSAQSPQLEATDLTDLDQPFLGGAIAPRPPYFTVSHASQHGWVIDGGAVHGVQGLTANGETTLLALFPFDSSPEQLRQLPQAVAIAAVQTVLPQLSQIQITQGAERLTSDTTYKAVVTSLPLPPLSVFLEGDETGVALIRQALRSGQDGQPSLYVRETDQLATANFRMLARNSVYGISRPTDDRLLVAPIADYSLATAGQIVQRLEHIARWQTIATLASPANSRIPANAVQMQIEVNGTTQQAMDLRLEYQYVNGKWTQPTFKLNLCNTWTEPLYCALLDLTEQFSVSADLFPGGGVWLQPGEEAWGINGNLIYCTVPKELWQQGITEYQDLLKLIVSTAEFDATFLQQDKLDLPPTRSVSRSPGRGKGTLNRLMNRVTTRTLGREPESDELCDDWLTSQVQFTTVRPQEAIALQTDRSIPLGAGVTLEPHPGLQATARLTTVPQSTRDLGNDLLPPILRENPEVIQPFQFTVSRGTDPGLSVLELTNVGDYQAVTPETPLTVVADLPLAENEHLLSIAYDGEFFLPLGVGRRRDNRTEIKLERLPEPVSMGKRSLGGSIRILFQKVIAQTFGTTFEYPLLAVADVGTDETVQYETNLDAVQQRVATADRIMLYIHGIIGDTRSMVGSVRRAKVALNGQKQLLADAYDLVLAFDYENLNTSIEDNARLLKQRLQAVGLGPNHGKTLHIVAHSMGGLVSRWFIEREGGNQMVQHLIMLGTPNAGSPWSTVQELVTPVLAFGLNSLSTVVWPAKILGILVASLEAIDVSLDQMKPDSDFLKTLAASEAPGIPYSVVAGNTSIIQPKSAEQVTKIQALLRKVSKSAVEFPFLGQPNDIAVLVQSIKSVPEGRMPQPVIQEVACDHLVYFGNPAGLKGLSEAATRALGTDHHSSSVSPSPVVTPPEVATVQSENLRQTVSPQTLSEAPAQSDLLQESELLAQSNEEVQEHSVSQSGQNWHRWWLTGLGILAIVMVAVVVLWPRRSQLPQSQPQSQLNADLLFPKGV
jgi:pimeloyl-ACP methyl ester carboxylesterase